VTPPSESSGRLNGAINRVVGHVAPPVIGAIDVDAVVQRVDLDALLADVDLDRLLENVDLNAVLQRVDLNALVDQVDMAALIEKVDVAAVAERAEIGELVARSTSEVAGSTLDLARRQLVGLDVIVIGVVNRMLRRDPDELKPGPELLVPAKVES